MAEGAESEAAPDLFQTNLAAFKRWAPHLYGRLAAIKAPNSQLAIDPAGRLDMTFLGQGFYNGDAVGATANQIDRFFENPQRQTLNEPEPEKLAGACGDFCIAVTQRLGQLGIAYDPGHSPPDAEFLVVFGVGLGLHLGPLIERSGARLVILIEPNPEFLYHSLFVTEWHALFEAAAERKFVFIVERDAGAIASKVGHAVRANNPALIDGLYFYTHYPSVILEHAKDRIRRQIFLTLVGLGFFEDELVMTRNAAANLSRGPVGILSDYHAVRDEPVFIVGSGPSVESDLDFIAQKAGQAVIISIGTGLRILLHRGIRPDFHVELENAEPTVHHLAETAEAFPLDGITLIASVTVQPAVPPMFDRTILFFREVVSSTTAFGGSFQVLKPAGPTVANTALISAIRMGFREIYLFGVDMGSKREGRFHAANSIYATGALSEYAEPSRLFAGNFGGEASGETILNWSRSVLEGVANAYRSVAIYNCSDGVRIAGAVPKVARAVELPDRRIDRAALEQSVAGSLRVYTAELLRETWDGETRRAEAEQLFDLFAGVLQHAPDDRGIDWIHDLYRVVGIGREKQAVAASYLTGTLVLLIGCLRWYDRRITGPGARIHYREVARDALQATLDDMKARLEALFREIDDMLPPAG